METKVNFALVGAFVLALGGLLVAGVLWLAAGGAFQTPYDLYQAIEDESVSGLNLNAPVKFNGVEVGKVREIHLDPTNPALVHLLFAIEHGTPIKTDTVAVLRTQGLTGIAYVELSGGAAQAELLRAVPPNRYPVIPTRPSLGARLENVLTSVLAKIDDTSASINAILSPANQDAFKSTLADVAALARTLAARKGVIEAGISAASRTFQNTASASAQAGPVVERIGRSADAVEKMGTEVARTAAAATGVVSLASTQLQGLGTDTMPELTRLLGELNALSVSLRRLTEQTERDPRGLLFGRKPVPPGPGETTP
jgi:phospholipid/cholesterol/gamma-HCH transport system substrate-binding protein